MSWRSSKCPAKAQAGHKAEVLADGGIGTDARQTGANSGELGAPRRWGSGSASPAPPPPSSTEREPPADGPRKRRSRWGDASDKVNLAGLPTAINGKVTSK